MLSLTDKMPPNTMLNVAPKDRDYEYLHYIIYKSSAYPGFCVLSVSYDLAWGLAHRKASKTFFHCLMAAVPQKEEIE